MKRFKDLVEYKNQLQRQLTAKQHELSRFMSERTNTEKYAINNNCSIHCTHVNKMNRDIDNLIYEIEKVEIDIEKVSPDVRIDKLQESMLILIEQVNRLEKTIKDLIKGV